MNRIIVFAAFAFALASCKEDTASTQDVSVPEKQNVGVASHQVSPDIELVDNTGNTSIDDQASSNRTLSYTHMTSARTRHNEVRETITDITNFCAQLDGCLILESGINENEHGVNGSFKARSTPEGIPLLNARLHQGDGKLEVISQNTTAEDMSGPLTDVERRLSMLYRQRDSLEELYDKTSNNIDALIKLSQQLSRIQSSIEATEGQEQQIKRQTESERWHLTVHSLPSTKTTIQPIKDAFKKFPLEISQATASFILSVSWILPWSVLFIVLYFGFVRIRRRRKEK